MNIKDLRDQAGIDNNKLQDKINAFREKIGASYNSEDDGIDAELLFEAKHPYMHICIESLMGFMEWLIGKGILKDDYETNKESDAYNTTVLFLIVATITTTIIFSMAYGVLRILLTHLK